MTRHFLSSLMCLIVTQPVLATGKAVQPCSASSVRSVPRPLHPQTPESAQFELRYELLTGSQSKGRRLVIFLPGGPGETSIGLSRDMFNLPDDVDLVLTDPRGVGCNAISEQSIDPKEFYRSSVFAMDVLHIIQAQSPQAQEVVLFGASYGTVLATHVAFLSQTQLGRPLKAVVLDGVLGRAFNANERLSDMAQSLSAFIGKLSPKSKKVLLEEENPFGIEGGKWFVFLLNAAGIGVEHGKPNPMLEFSDKLLDPDATPAEINPLRMLFLGSQGKSEASEKEGSAQLFKYVQCRELADPSSGPPPRTYGLEHFASFRSSLKVKSTLCSDVSADRLFDSAEYQIESNIYYFSRARDYRTPIRQAKYHYRNQQKALSKQFVAVGGGGHADVLLNYFKNSQCAKSAWTGIFNGSDLSSALAGCGRPFMVRFKGD